jgi:hypothetical protein
MTIFSWRGLLPALVNLGCNLNDLLADPMLRLIMDADRFSEVDVRRFCEQAT